MGRELPHVDGVEHRFVSAGGLRTHVAEAGDPEAPPLLLVHGWPQNWFAWHELIGAARGGPPRHLPGPPRLRLDRRPARRL